MNLTLLHSIVINLITVITFFPGSILLLVNRIKSLRRYSEASKYLCCATAVVLVNITISHPQMFLYGAIILLAFFCFTLDLCIETKFFRKSEKPLIIFNTLKRLTITVVLFPVLEEYIYRFFTYEVIINYSGNVIFYIIFSVLIFIASHYYSQRLKALYKIPFAILQAILYSFTLDIYVCLSVHLVFNSLILIYNNSKYMSKFR
jgi:hypothetical protein